MNMAMPEQVGIQLPSSVQRGRSANPSEHRAIESYLLLRDAEKQTERIRECIRLFEGRSRPTEDDVRRCLEIERESRDDFVRRVWSLTQKPRRRSLFIERLKDLIGAAEAERSRARMLLCTPHIG